MTDTTSMRAPVRSVAEVAVADAAPPAAAQPRVVIATIMPPEGTTGVQTHVREVRAYLAGTGRDVTVVHPAFSGNGARPCGLRRRVPLSIVSDEVGVAWYREWHWRFLRRALRRELADREPPSLRGSGPLAATAPHSTSGQRRDSAS